MPAELRFSTPILDSLRRSQLFTGVPSETVKLALESGERVEVKHGSDFYHSEDPANCLFVLTSGRVKLRIVMPSGYRMMFRFIIPGDFFGYQVVFNNSCRYFTSAEAAEDSEALSFSRAATRKLLNSHPAIAINALSTSLKLMQEYQERLAEMACETVPSRIARRLLELESGPRKNGPVSFDGELTREDLAGLSGSTLHTVSRILGRWERQRIVEKSRGTVRIIARSKLMQIARL